jgi:hypothetical protein
MMEFEHPRFFLGMRAVVSLLSLGSVVVEIWIGVNIFSWWPGLFLFLVPTVVLVFFVKSMSWLKSLALGVVLVCAGGYLLA